MARAGRVASRSEINVAEDFTCAICRGLFVDPRILKCKHVFCLNCLKGLVQNTEAAGIIICPVCRQPASASEACNNPATDIANKMEGKRQGCHNCCRWIPLVDYAQHVAECKSKAGVSNISTTTSGTGERMLVDGADWRGSSAQDLSRPSNVLRTDAQQRTFGTVSRDTQSFTVASNIAAGRQTFACPYCAEQNLIQEELVLHCSSLHKQEGNHRLVCPICASMPWGDPRQKSQHLIDHLQLRHKYDHGAINGYELDEDGAFQVAIEKSVNEYYDSFKKGY